MRALRTSVIASVIALVAFVGCEQQAADTETGEMTDTVAMTETETEAPAPEPITTDLEAIDDSGITGTIEMTPRDDQVEFVVNLDGIEQGQAYTAHLHEGTCDIPRETPEEGRVSTIGTIDLAAGNSAATTMIERSRLDPGAEGLFVEIHGADERVVSCTDVEISDEMAGTDHSDAMTDEETTRTGSDF